MDNDGGKIRENVKGNNDNEVMVMETVTENEISLKFSLLDILNKPKACITH